MDAMSKVMKLSCMQVETMLLLRWAANVKLESWGIVEVATRFLLRNQFSISPSRMNGIRGGGIQGEEEQLEIAGVEVEQFSG